MSHNRKIQVLFLAYPWVGLNSGGFQLQIETTAAELIKLGVEVVFFDPWKNQLPDVDICHFFSIDSSLFHHANRAIQLKKPLVISPVTNMFSNPVWQTKIKVTGSGFLPGVYSNLKMAKKMLSSADMVIAQTQQETNFLVNVFRLSSQKCTIVPNGIEKRFSTGDPLLFETKYNAKNFLIQVGSINSNKNQLNLISAMQGQPYQLFIIGQYTNPEGQRYLERCRDLADKNVHFIGHLSHEDPMLLSAYAAAKVLVLPSFSETWALCLYEAALANCSIIASKTVPVHPDIREYISFVDPNKPADIASAIRLEMTKTNNNKLREHVSKMASWSDVGGSILKIYEKVLNDRQ